MNFNNEDIKKAQFKTKSFRLKRKKDYSVWNDRCEMELNQKRDFDSASL